MKWAGKSITGTDDDWIPVLVRLDSFQNAKEACGLFSLLRHEPIVVEFPGITFDIFLAHGHIPFGAYVSSESCDDSEAEIKLEIEAV